jgi:uncharacterized protein YigE (DUF2233 family)
MSAIGRFGRILLFAAIALLAGGCGSPEPDPAGDPAVTATGQAFCQPRRFEGSVFTVCPYEAARSELRLAWKNPGGTPLRDFAALEQSLGAEAGKVRFAMNGGMFDEAGAPIGLYVERGKTLKKLNRNPGPGNFHMKPNGVFSVDARGRAAIVTADAYARLRTPEWATQSGPMLVIDGKLHPKFDRDGESRLVRNGVGVRDPGTAFFVVSEEGVSFGRFARFFRDELDCRNALFLDGSVSSLWDPAAARQDDFTELGPMLVVLARDRPARPLKQKGPPPR